MIIELIKSESVFASPETQPNALMELYDYESEPCTQACA